MQPSQERQSPRDAWPERAALIVYALTIAISAFLLFQIQPMIGKFILPWFGGSSAVWTTSMLFFQVLLLGGYAYAHFLSGLPPRRQTSLHLLVLLLVLAWLAVPALRGEPPIVPDPRWKPAGEGLPVLQILTVLAASVGVPYLLLSTTSSLLQAWYRDGKQRASPYAFYALSNAASLAALLSYPVLVEPVLTRGQQALFWSLGFGVYLLFTMLSALILHRAVAARRAIPVQRAITVRHDGASLPLEEPADAAWQVPPAGEQPGAMVYAPPPVDGALFSTGADNDPLVAPPDMSPLSEPDRVPDTAPDAVPDAPPARPGPGAYLAWIGLAACSSVLLLATTNHVTQDLTSAPFLWVLPLSLYLLSFVLAFSTRQSNLRWAYALLTLAVLFIGYLLLDRASALPIDRQVAANALLLFVICMLCHSELYAQRPHPRYLTNFYLMVSVGGALGGLLVSVIAPLVFFDYWEYPLGLVASAGVAAWVAFNSPQRWMRWLRYPAGVAAMVLSGFILSTSVYWITSTVEMTRSFYGVLRIRSFEDGEISGYRLLHGGIMHGSQVQNEPDRFRPTTYYTESTGVGIALKSDPRYQEGAPLRVGVVGLGVGTLASYGRAGDTIRFYEINQQVVDLARDARYFSYLADSPAEIEVVLGDARLSMERELAEGRPQGYHLLAVDAFSGDSIPTHLINREAMQVYLDHLAPDGILAFHISNRHIDLQPVVARLAQEYALDSARIEGGSADWQGSFSVWILLGSREAIRDRPEIATVAQLVRTNPDLRIWTDDFSNLFQVIRR